MTIEEALIKQFEIDFANFRVGYGYNFDYTNFSKGFLDPKSINNFPAVSFSTGHETLTRTGEGRNKQSRELKCAMSIYLQTSTEKGKLTDAVAMAVSDGVRFLHGDASISGFATAEHKVLKWQKVQSKGIYGSMGVQKLECRDIFRPLDNGTGKGEVFFGIVVTYFDFHNSIDQPVAQ